MRHTEDQKTARYTANLNKGAAAILEVKTLFRIWDFERDETEQIEEIAGTNLLGKASRRRVKDMAQRIFKGRFFDNEGRANPRLIAQLVRANVRDSILIPILYYHTSLKEKLLYDFVTKRLFDLHSRGRLFIDQEDALEFIRGVIKKGMIAPPWSEYNQKKVARGLLTACRDFGLLGGKTRKKFASMYLPIEDVVYVAYHLKDQGHSTSQLIRHSNWQLFLITPEEVEKRLLEAHQERYLQYFTAGNIHNIVWSYRSLEEVVNAIIERAH